MAQRRPPSPLADLAAAWMLLCRVPAPFSAAAAARGAAAAWAYPLIGAGLGAASGAALAALLLLGLAPGPAAALALALGFGLSGGLHEDGLADAADGLLGGRGRARALEIMRDSRIGAFGAAALTLALLARWSALAEIGAAGPWLAAAALIGTGALSRAALSLGLAFWPSARAEGLAAAQGRASRWSAAIALLLAGAAAGALAPLFGAAALLGGGIALLGALLFLRAAARKLGGQTGDVLGAAQQIAEILFLAALTAAWA